MAGLRWLVPVCVVGICLAGLPATQATHHAERVADEPGVAMNDTNRTTGDGSTSRQWSQTYSGDQFVGGAVADAGYLLVGSTGDAGVAVATDRNGSTRWRQRVPGGEHTRFDSAVELPGGGYIAAGTANATSPYGAGDEFAVRLSTDGSVVWRRTYGSGSLRDIGITPDGRPIVVGAAIRVLDPETGEGVRRIDRLGGPSNVEVLRSGSGYAFAVNTGRPRIVRTDANFTVQARNRYGDRGDRITGLDQRPGGGFVFSGVDYDRTGTGHGWGVVTAANLTTQWTARPATVTLDAAAGPNGTLLIGSTGSADLRWIRRNRTPARLSFDPGVYGVDRRGRRVLVTGRRGTISGMAAAVVRDRPTITVATDPTTTQRGVARIRFRVATATGREFRAYRWDFDTDGAVETTTTRPTAAHVYNQSGNHTARVVAVDDAGVRHDETVSVRATDRTPPTARLAHPANRLVAANRTSRLLATTSTDNVNITAYRWDVGADGTVEATTRRPVFSYPFGAVNRTYRLRLTAVDANGNANATTVELRTVDNDRPEIQRLPDTVRGGDPAVLAVAYRNRVGTTNVTWSFPDGTVIHGQRVTYKFPKPGETYPVTVTVTDEHGLSDTERTNVSVVPARDQVPAGGAGPGFTVPLAAVVALLLAGVAAWRSD